MRRGGGLSAPAAGVPRFGVEVPTVAGRDFADGRDAPNADVEAPRDASGWFRHPASGATLPG